MADVDGVAVCSELRVVHLESELATATKGQKVNGLLTRLCALPLMAEEEAAAVEEDATMK